MASELGAAQEAVFGHRPVGCEKLTTAPQALIKVMAVGSLVVLGGSRPMLYGGLQESILAACRRPTDCDDLVQALAGEEDTMRVEVESALDELVKLGLLVAVPPV